MTNIHGSADTIKELIKKYLVQREKGYHLMSFRVRIKRFKIWYNYSFEK